MTDTQTRGMDIAPDVLDTIVALALKDVEGVAVVGQTSTGILSFFGSKQDQKGVRVSQVTSDTIDVSVSITVLNGFSLDKIAADARKAIADAILAQTGYTVNRVDIQVLYQAEILETDPATIIEEGRLVDETQLLGNYARRLIEGATADQEAIDAELVEASENWALDRMPVVDRSLLRMAAYEMRSVDEVPISVSINEAVNLAKEFGGEDSPRFVNGILGRIATKLEEEAHE